MLRSAFDSRIHALPKPVAELGLADLADEYGDTRLLMQRWKPAVNPHVQRFAQLGAELLARYEKQDPEVAPIVSGRRWKIPISIREKKRTVINIYALVRKWGLKRTAELWKPALSIIEREIPKAQHGKYITEERSGPRTIGEPVLMELPPAA